MGSANSFKPLAKLRTFYGHRLASRAEAGGSKQRKVQFGIRNRFVLLIGGLILLGVWISRDSMNTTLDYVVKRELVDLQDETRNAKLEMELALQAAYAQVVEKLAEQAEGNDYEVQLMPVDPQRGISSARVIRHLGEQDGESREVDLRRYGFEANEVLSFSRQQSGAAAIWSGIYWIHSDSRPDGEAYINALVPLGRADGEQYWLVQFDLTDFFKNLTSGSRSLVYFVNGSTGRGPVLGLTPTGSPMIQSGSGAVERNGDRAQTPLLASTAVTSERASADGARAGGGGATEDAGRPDIGGTGEAVEDLEVDPKDPPAKQLTAENGIEGLVAPSETHRSSQIARGPEDVVNAVREFQNARGDPTAARFGIQYPPRNPATGIPPGLKVTALLGHEGKAVETLWYSETENLPRAVFEQVAQSELARVESTMRMSDPFARIDPLNPQVGQLRIRASSPASLALVKQFLEMELQDESAVANPLQWNDTLMDEFVLSVQAINAPASNDSEGSGDVGASDQIGYLVRAASLSEIRESASEGLENLTWRTNAAAFFALGLTLLWAHYLTRPLSKMTLIAQEVSGIGAHPSSQDRERVKKLLERLPIRRRDEVGTLARQFKQTTDELIERNLELRRKTQDVIAEQRKSEQSEREKAIAAKISEDRIQLLATVSHDMRQPLHPIFYHTEKLLKQEGLAPDQQKRIRTIVKNATELSFLVEDILDYKRILAGDVQIAVEKVSLDDLLEELVSHYSDVAKQRKIKLARVNVWDGDIQTDRLRLKRVLNNLISNAIKATRDGEVRLQVSPLGVDYVEISVTDTGCGMNELQKKIVFQPVEQRVQIERQHRALVKGKDANSTGLGLFISKQLIEAMGGDIRFTSEVGEGSTFVVRLPVVPPQEVSTTTTLNADPASARLVARSGATNGDNLPALAPGRRRPDIVAGSHEGNGFLRAVVVDDDPRCTRILAEMLEDLGYRSEQIHDGETAVERVSATLPDLVTLDVFMPGIDGWETLRRLKDRPLTEHVPVIMVTVDPDEAKAALLGASGFVNKPVERAALTTSVLTAVGGRKGARVLVVDDDDECRNQLEELLQPLRCEVLVASDGIEALEQLSASGGETIDLAIVDLYMPNLDGFALIEKLSQMPRTRDVPIIVLSAGLLSDAERADLEPRVARFFSKGAVDFDTLRNEISRLVIKHGVDQSASEQLFAGAAAKD